jgi:hypothetical protein
MQEVLIKFDTIDKLLECINWCDTNWGKGVIWNDEGKMSVFGNVWAATPKYENDKIEFTIDDSIDITEFKLRWL